MTAYILPEFKEKFEKLINSASRHLERKPTITFSEPMTKTKHTYINWKCDGEHGQNKYKEVITVIEVTIDDITSGDWVLVANVFFKEGIVGMVSGKYYKDIPSHLGLDYAKCDYCGHTHPNRTKSHIVYNTKTGEWKQIVCILCLTSILHRKNIFPSVVWLRSHSSCARHRFLQRSL